VRRFASPRALSVSKSSDRVSNLMGAKLSVTTPLLFGRRGVRSGLDSWDHGLRTSSRALISPAPPRTHKARVLESNLHWPGPPMGSGAATCGSQIPWACPSGLASGVQTSLSPGKGVRCRHVPPRAAKEATAGPTLPRACGRRPSVGRQPSYRIKYG
jgi:hypothetical protein